MTAARADIEAAPGYTTSAMTDAEMPVATDDAVTGDAAAETTANTDTGMVREPVVRDGYTTAAADFLTSEKLTGASVYDANDEEIGNVATLVLSDDGQVTQAVIDVGGWLGMGEKPVALNLTDVDILRNEAGDDVRVYLTKTKEELEAMPTFEG
jgi:hypothetical protein